MRVASFNSAIKLQSIYNKVNVVYAIILIMRKKITITITKKHKMQNMNLDLHKTMRVTFFSFQNYKGVL